MGRNILTRENILKRLRETTVRNEPIIAAGSSCGLIAKCAEKGGADIIVVYSTGLSRLKGLPTTIIGDSNAITLSMAEEILNVVQNAPVVAGIQAADPRFWDMDYFIDKFITAGFSGIINFPTMGLHEPGTMWRELYEKVNLGIGREVEAVRVAREKNLFTMAYVFRPDEGNRMVEAGLDCIVAHVGGTAGGMTGFGATPHEEAAKVAQKIFIEAKKINPDIICLAHGGPFAGPKDTEYLYEHTDAVGFVGASSIERIPIERAIVEELKKFKSFAMTNLQ